VYKIQYNNAKTGAPEFLDDARQKRKKKYANEIAETQNAKREMMILIAI